MVEFSSKGLLAISKWNICGHSGVKIFSVWQKIFNLKKLNNFSNLGEGSRSPRSH